MTSGRGGSKRSLVSPGVALLTASSMGQASTSIGSAATASTATPPTPHKPPVAVAGAPSGGHGLDRFVPNAEVFSTVLIDEDGDCEMLSMDGSHRDLVFFDHPTPVLDDPRGPFVAGSQFFNYQLYGGLRKGGAIQLFSRAYGGYALAAAFSGYAYAIVTYLILRLPDRALGIQDATSLKNVLALQWAVVLIVGLVSDSFAVFRCRRNPYMLLGWGLSAVLWLVLFIVVEATDNPPEGAILVLVTGAFLGLVVATIAMDIRFIELTQQEGIQTRGRLLGTYQGLRIGAQVLVHALIGLVVIPDRRTTLFRLPFPVSYVYLHLGLLSLVPVYGIWRHAQENVVERAPRLRATLRGLWLGAQQRVIWQLIVFNGVLFFFALFEVPEVRRAMQIWSHESSRARMVRNGVGDGAFVLVILLWRHFGVNQSWRRLTGWTLGTWAVIFFVTSSLIILDGVRAPWLNTLAYVLKAPLRTLVLLSAFVPAVEIAHEGTEGATFALLSSCQSITKLLGAEVARGIVHASKSLQFSTATILKSSRETKTAVFNAMFCTTLLVLISLVGLGLLPRQKLDAQQLRVYGGYSRPAVLVLAAGYALCFPIVTYLQIHRLGSG